MKATQVLKNKKGFTLIEIIVVLIILAILAAAGIPSMIGFIDDSRGKAYIAEARVGLVAAQVILTENEGDATVLAAAIADAAKATNPDGRFYDLVKGVGNVAGYNVVTSGAGSQISDGQVTGITYISSATGSPYYEVTIDVLDSSKNKVEKKTRS